MFPGAVDVFVKVNMSVVVVAVLSFCSDVTIYMVMGIQKSIRFRRMRGHFQEGYVSFTNTSLKNIINQLG